MLKIFYVSTGKAAIHVLQKCSFRRQWIMLSESHMADRKLQAIFIVRCVTFLKG